MKVSGSSEQRFCLQYSRLNWTVFLVQTKRATHMCKCNGVAAHVDDEGHRASSVHQVSSS